MTLKGLSRLDSINSEAIHNIVNKPVLYFPSHLGVFYS